MKKINFMIALGLISAASMQAQSPVVSLGFESGDQKYTTEDAYTPGGTYGDWINQHEGDVWTEPYADDKHSGEFSFRMQNAEDFEGNTWDRGFKVGNLQLKENTAYRVGFWVKADPTHFDAGTGNEVNNKLKSTLSIGKEYFDMPISTASGQQYYYTWDNMTGEWKHFSYVTYFTNKADQDALSESYSGKTDSQGNKVSEVGDPFPDTYFITINMYNPGEYILDDIVLEEGVTFNQATFVDDVIKLDFGYPTNIADLAKAANGTLTLDPAQVSVTINGTAAPVEFLEGKSDGFLYIFLNETYASPEDEVKVSFTPAADCPIVYNTDRRPSADVTAEMKVLGFTGETAYFDDTIDAMPAAWAPAVMVSSNPENESFEIDGATFKNIAITYDKVVSLDMASATITKNGVSKDLTSGMSLSEDGKTINTAVSGLEDGEYTFMLSGVTNKYGVDCEDVQITFALGEDSDTSTSEEVFATDFDNQLTGGVPVGWITYNEAGYHLYGFNEDGSQFNYNWGGNPGGGGARLYDGFSGDFVKALYWGTRGTNEGFASFGEQVKDYILPDGSLDPNMPTDISLYLQPRKYQISFLMAAWKGEPKFTFTLEDLDGNVYAKFTDITAAPNANGATGPISGSVKCVTDFTVDKEGYYVLKFTAAEAQWQEYLLANVKLITMPSKAAYYKQLLAAAVETAKSVYGAAEGEEYDGTTKSEFKAAIDNAENGHFTSPTEINALIEELGKLGEKMQARVTNIDNFEQSILTGMSAKAELEETKYVNSPYYKEAAAVVDKYIDANPSALSDEELVEATPAVVNASALLGNVKSMTDDLTWQCYKAAQLAQAFGANVPGEYWQNTEDNPPLAAKIMKNATQAMYKAIVADTLANVPMSSYAADDQSVEGYDFTGLIKNSRFYTMVAKGSENPFPHWTADNPTGLNYDGEEPSAAKPVVNVMGQNWQRDYNVSQTIENVPVGVYNILLNCRTSAGYNSETAYEDGTWDKYIYATVGDKTYIQKFAEGGWGTHFCMIEGVEIKDGTVTIGAVEKNSTNYSTNTFVDDARMFFMFPVEGVDYSALIVDDTAGDVNEDGVVNINDVVAIINVMAGTADWANANVNGDPDGAVDINDVVAVINIMAAQ